MIELKYKCHPKLVFLSSRRSRAAGWNKLILEILKYIRMTLNAETGSAW